MENRKFAVMALALLSVAMAAGCRKRAPVSVAPLLPKAEEPKAPKPNPPIIHEFLTEPGTIERGQYALLRWTVSDATELVIQPELGQVSTNGRRRISPVESTTYTLQAKGPGGEASAATTLRVTLPTPPPAPTVAPPPSLSERVANEVRDVYFDFDRYDLRADATGVLSKNATALQGILSDFPKATLIVEGHCDERGSAEYNLGLGDRRASAAKTFLRDLGVAPERLLVISYGKERPQCTDANEECWQRNRRAHFVPGENRQ